MKKLVGGANSLHPVMAYLAMVAAVSVGLLGLPEASVCIIILLALIVGGRKLQAIRTTTTIPVPRTRITSPSLVLTYIYALSKADISKTDLFIGFIGKIYLPDFRPDTFSEEEKKAILDLAAYFSSDRPLSEAAQSELGRAGAPVPGKSDLAKAAFSLLILRLFFEPFRRIAPSTQIPTREQVALELLGNPQLSWALNFLANMNVPIDKNDLEFFQTLSILFEVQSNIRPGIVQELKVGSEAVSQFATVSMRNASSLKLIHEISQKQADQAPDILVIGPGFLRDAPSISPGLCEIHAAAPRASITIVDPYIPSEFQPEKAPSRAYLEKEYGKKPLNTLLGEALSKTFISDAATGIQSATVIKVGIEDVPLPENKFDVITAHVSLVYANCLDIIKCGFGRPLARLVELLQALKPGGVFLCDEVELKTIFLGLNSDKSETPLTSHDLELAIGILNELLNSTHKVSTIQYLARSIYSNSSKSYAIWISE